MHEIVRPSSDAASTASPLRRLVDVLPVGILVLRIDKTDDPKSWKVVEANPAGLRLTRAAEPAVGQTLHDFAPEAFETDLPRACLEAILNNEERTLPDYSWKWVPGKRFALKIFPLGGTLLGLTFEDITAQKAAQDALARSNADLTQFAYVASHDLQEPLRKASAFSDLIASRLEGRLDETDKDLLGRMRRALEGMQKLIDALLTLARVSAGVPPREVDLSAVAAETVESLDHALSRSGGTVELGPLPAVAGDPEQMRQLLANLIGNAIKFHRPDRPPRVRVQGRTRADGRAEFSVRDEGVGFDMKFAERMFQPFLRLHNRSDFPGTGMGLAICHKIVARHGGDISVDSAVDRGTTFTVVLPAAGERTREAAPVLGGGSWNKE